MAAVLGNEKWWPWVEKLWLPQSRAAPSSDVKPCSCRQLTVLWDQPRKLFRVEFCFFLIERCQKHDPSHLEIHPSIPSVNTWVLFCAKHRARSCLHNAGGGGGEQAGGVNQMRPLLSLRVPVSYVHIHRYWRLCPFFLSLLKCSRGGIVCFPPSQRQIHLSSYVSGRSFLHPHRYLAHWKLWRF